MHLAFAPELQDFRARSRRLAGSQLAGPFAVARPEQPCRSCRRAARLGAGAWRRTLELPSAGPSVRRPRRPIAEQVIFAEEYARAKAPAAHRPSSASNSPAPPCSLSARGPKARFLPDIARGRAIWCQGYSEPNAGSDLANVRTKARLRRRHLPSSTARKSGPLWA